MEALFEHCEEGFVAYKSPITAVVVSWRGFAGKSFNNDIGAESAQDFDKEVYILFDLPEAEIFGVAVILIGHCGTGKYLQLVELDGSQGQRVDYCGLGYQLLVALSGQAEYKVGSDMETSLGGHLDGSACCGEVVSSIYRFQGEVIHGLYTILYGDIFPLLVCYRGEIVEFLVIHTVGACTYDYASHFGVSESLIVECLQTVEGGVGIRERLKISQVA